MVYHPWVIANATTPTQIALANFMLTPEAYDFKKKVKEIFQERRDVIVEGLNSLDGVKCQKPSGSFFCYPDISGSKYPDGKEFSQKAFEDARVVVVPGTEFGPATAQNVRASFGSVSVPKINEVVERLRKIL